MNIKRKVFESVSTLAVKRAVAEDAQMSGIWDRSLSVLPDLQDHYATVKIKAQEGLLRVRLLICAQALFVQKVIEGMKQQGHTVGSWVDVGDSDGSARELFLANVKENNNAIKTLGINFEQEAVDLMRSKGLPAEKMNAMDLHKKNVECDLVSVFETLEHLPDPVGFLECMQQVVGQRLLISVPLITRSRVGLKYLTPNWESFKTPSYCNNHVFELSPVDWTKLFKHTGWTVEYEWKVRQYPKNGPLKLLMQPLWRKISFEGYWFVSLKKDNQYSKKFVKG